MDIRDNICRSHSARNNKVEALHTAPSALSRRDLEDAYYSILDANRELKCTANSQNDKLKLLTTKLMRVTAHKSGVTKDNKPSQSIIGEQNDVIEDLKLRNERLSDKIRKLNMKLCSTKQFLKKPTNKCLKCTSNRKSIKNTVATRSATSLQHLAVSTQCTSTDNRLDSVRSMETNTEYSAQFESPTEKKCEDNRCKTQIEDMVEKIQKLQQESETAQNQYTAEKQNLTDGIKKLQEDIKIVQAQCKVLEESNCEWRDKHRDLERKLNQAEGMQCNLKTELSIEQKRCRELHLEVKSMERSNQLVKFLEHNLISAIQNKSKVQSNDSVTFSSAQCSTPRKDDSGYIDSQTILHDNVYKGMLSLNEELQQKVLKLESELELQKDHNAEQASTLLKLMTENLTDVKSDKTKVTSFDEEQCHVSTSVARHKYESIEYDIDYDRNDINENYTEGESEKGDAKSEKEDINLVNFNTEIHKNTEKVVVDNGSLSQNYNTNQEMKAKIQSTKTLKHDSDKIIKKKKEMNGKLKKLEDRKKQVHQTNTVNVGDIHDRVLTYSIHNSREVNKDRLTSPDNTDLDVSSISNESHTKSTKTPSLSLGEDRGVFSYSDVSSDVTTDGYLSEGELPLKDAELSIGERLIKNKLKSRAKSNNGRVETTSDSLKAVKRELARCRYLLATDG